MTKQPAYRALVVDDVTLVCRATTRALEQEGFACESARDGREALDKARAQPFDAVVTDLRMPTMNGHQLAVELLKEPQPPVVVVLTGVDEPRLVKDLIQRGVDEVLLKPIEYTVLAAKVAALVQRRHGKSDTAAPVDPPIARPKEPDTECCPLAAVALPPPSAAEVAAKVVEVTGRLPTPPSDFDAFHVASGSSLTASELKGAVAVRAEVACEAINLANRVVFAATQKISGLERVVAELRQSLSFGRIAVLTLGPFVAGIVVGWLLAVLTPH